MRTERQMSSDNARRRPRLSLLALVIALCYAAPSPSSAVCEASTVALQVLGSGGPVPDSGRASSGYLIWVDGRARVMVDAGGGTFLRFGESGARIEDLDLIALTHFHTDHAADLPAILKGGFFSPRSRPLPVSGPTLPQTAGLRRQVG